MPTFPTNKLLVAAAVNGLGRAKSSSAFTGIVGLDWGREPGRRGPVINTAWSRVRSYMARERTELPGEW